MIVKLVNENRAMTSHTSFELSHHLSIC